MVAHLSVRCSIYCGSWARQLARKLALAAGPHHAKGTSGVPRNVGPEPLVVPLVGPHHLQGAEFLLRDAVPCFLVILAERWTAGAMAWSPQGLGCWHAHSELAMGF